MFENKILKDWEKALAAGLIISLLLSLISFSAECKNIRRDVLRLHILANSDSAYDQELKLAVRDEILAVSEDIFDGAADIDDALEKAEQNKDVFLAAADQVIRERGADYPVSLEIAKTHFDTRHYDTYTLPAGDYTALRVKIGKAKGHNWWCVMYPTLCLPACTNYDEALDSGEQEIIENYPKYEIRFKTVELFEQIKSFFSDED